MRYSLDNMFTIGWGHKVCQDYSCIQLISLCNKLAPVILVSDGCSSSRDTDIGARLIARSALVNAGLVLQATGNDRAVWGRYGQAIAVTLHTVAATLALPEEATDATLMYGIGNGKSFRIGFYGDGFAIIRNRAGETRVIEVRYESNAPRYLSYWLDKRRAARYAKEFPGQVVIRTFANTGAGFVFLNETRQDVCEPIAMTYPENELSLVMLATDGLGSFTKAGVEPVPLLDILPEVIGFKGMAGEFLQRRITRMKSTLEKAGIRHFDDIGLAACHLRPEEEGTDEH